MTINRCKGYERLVRVLIFIAVVLVAPSITTGQDRRQLYPRIDQQLQPLKARFNADVGKVRVLVIGDPTCGPCRHGASIIQQNVLSKFTTDKLAVYVVWVRMLNDQSPATLDRHAHQFAYLIPPGPRVTLYTDSETYVGREYGAVLGGSYGSRVWDVYLVFPADAKWGDAAPQPAYWEHQMGSLEPARFLDGPRFAEEVRKLLENIFQ